MADQWWQDPKALAEYLLTTIEKDIMPMTARGVSTGSKLFGAAILSRHSPATLTAATNDERTSPLLHGEINCIQKFCTVTYPDPSSRPHPRADCLFLATHEPCSLCLSGITWAGFGEILYLFTYEDSRDLFAIPHDINILEQVFRVRAEGESDAALAARPLYNRKNDFFTARSVADVVAEIADEGERKRLEVEVERVKGLYNALSETYQKGKKAGTESSSVWK